MSIFNICIKKNKVSDNVNDYIDKNISAEQYKHIFNKYLPADILDIIEKVQNTALIICDRNTNTCPICFDITNSAVIACGHFICSRCLLTLIKQKHSKCPLCNVVIEHIHIPDNISIAIIKSNKLYIYFFPEMYFINDDTYKKYISCDLTNINDIFEKITLANYSILVPNKKTEEQIIKKISYFKRLLINFITFKQMHFYTNFKFYDP
jgi:hypothetical protein